MITNLTVSVALTNTGERVQSNQMGVEPQWHGINTKFHETNNTLICIYSKAGRNT